ncbi:MAG: MFS transporter [Nitrolancea sp.]
MNSRTLTSHRRASLFTLLSANAVSEFGSMLTMVALPWFVLQTTGSAAKAGITLAVDTVPILFAGLFGGVLVDRLGYKTSSVVADLSSGLVVAAIPLAYLTVGITFWQLLVLVFLASLVNQPGRIARTSLIPDLAERAGMPLVRVNSLAQSIPRLALLLGPPIAGLLVSLIGASHVLFIDAVTFVVSSLLVLAGIPRSAQPTDQTRESMLGEVLAGLKYIASDSLLLWLMIMCSVGSLVAEPLYAIVYPVYARQIYGDAVSLGLMFSALAAGCLAGLGLYTLFGTRIPYRVIFVGGFAARAVALWIMVMLPSLPILLAAIAIEAFCFEPINPLLISIYQERTPAGMRGRVFGTANAIAVGTLPIGTIIGGFLLAGPGLVPTIVIIAVACAVHVAFMAALPAFRDMPAVAQATT